MTQLIVNGLILPETSHDKYVCYPAPLSTQLTMISGRYVEEVRGNVQMIEYEYDFISPALWKSLATILRSGQPFTVAYLPDDQAEMQTSTFVRVSFRNPTFAFSRHGLPYWHGVKFTLREQRPHD